MAYSTPADALGTASEQARRTKSVLAKRSLAGSEPRGSAAPTGDTPAPRLLDAQLKADFVRLVNALPRAQRSELTSPEVDTFLWLGWLHRSGGFLGLSDEGVRLYASLAAVRT